jgi:hypothetical protein
MESGEEDEEEEESKGEEEDKKWRRSYSGRTKISQDAVAKNKAREMAGRKIDSKFCTECGVVSSHAHPL